ncbi:Phosphorylcholine metabolism protein LicD [Butyrivibrio sp. Su6]|uniref:LicD family protein n=1 Tax=Butyrivibrio sp. Su6 TaxID=1520810 RepID=UPI00089F46FC|nr:LicD family protein [Butyrivibrio sp. Su6]SEF67547.1 Phosphorylcholine metabolism protein LicD [Butyrivibrio sp. Su6]
MNHCIDFFRDEVRNGFYIPTAIKQAWACALDVLAEIDRICTSHNITYYADWGTLLGAVRHGGFIPWDDDLDICMKRDDYIRFREVADAELPPEFVIHDYERQENHWLFLARVVNSSKYGFNEDYLNRHYNMPWLIGVDIFLKDYLYKNPEDEKKRCDEILRILAVAEKEINLGNVSSARALYKKAEDAMSRVPESESDRICQIFPWGLKGNTGEPKEYYGEAVRLPFEDTTIPVPVHYNQLLSMRYGNYLEIHKVWYAHSYPAFDNQRQSFEEETSEKLPAFIYSDDLLKRAPFHTKNQPSKRTALFLPIGPREWAGFQKAYEKESASHDTDVFVVPIPLLFKDYFGRIKMSDEEIIAATRLSEYPSDLPLYNWLDIDLDKLCPDFIYIQNPYDDQNPCLTVPDYFYSQNLQQYTHKIVYIPISKTCEFTETDRNDQINMKFYVNMPALFYADEIWLQSENIKKQYLANLVNFSNSKNENYWESKLIVKSGLYDSDIKSDLSSVKRILFCICPYEIKEHQDIITDALKERINIFKNTSDKIAVTICSYPSDDSCAQLLLDIAAQEGLICDYIAYDLTDLDEIAMSFDAYYGSASPLVPVFAEHKKPVMISNYSV